MSPIPINLPALLVVAVLQVVLGFVWYSPVLFGNTWARAMGKSEAEARAAMKEGALWATIVSFVGALVMAFVLRHAVASAGATSIALGMVVGFWSWLGFIAVVMVNAVMYERRPWPLFFVNAGFYLVALLIAGAILAVYV